MTHPSSPPGSLFEKVVALCGVSPVLAPGMVRRALLDGKVQVEAATPADYRTALPRILARLRAYMPEDEAQKRARRISALLGAAEAGKSIDTEDESDWSLIGRVTEALRGGAPAGARSSSERAVPKSGETRLPSGSPSGETRLPSGETRISQSLSLDDDEDHTLMGRRYTADELALLQRSGIHASEPPRAPAGHDSSAPRRPLPPKGETNKR
jgi:hypothetical protein